jgi:hypothetical protein
VGAYLVAIEHLGAAAALGELLLETGRDRRLPGARQSRQPDDEPIHD